MHLGLCKNYLKLKLLFILFLYKIWADNAGFFRTLLPQQGNATLFIKGFAICKLTYSPPHVNSLLGQLPINISIPPYIHIV